MLGEILTKVRDELMKDPAMQLTESAPVFVKASELLPNHSHKGTRRGQDQEEEEEEKEEGNYADNELSLPARLERQDAFVHHHKPGAATVDDLP